MVKIFKDKKSGEIMVQSSCTDPAQFLCDLAEALAQVDKSAEHFHEVLQVSMPIAFKLAGYKADEVSEQRTLVCGRCSPLESAVIASAGK